MREIPGSMHEGGELGYALSPDGAVLPILHLNGYKIAGPSVLARISHESWRPCSVATAIPLLRGRR